MSVHLDAIHRAATQVEYEQYVNGAPVPELTPWPAPEIEHATFDYASIPPVRSASEVPIHYDIDGIIPSGSVVAFTGESGQGKSSIVMCMAAHIAFGSPFTGRATVQRPVLILDRENPEAVIAERMDRFGIANSDTFKVLHAGNAPDGEAPHPGGAGITAWVASAPVKPLIVVDSLVAFAQCDENDARAMRNELQHYRRLAHLGATVLLIHHSGKGETSREYRGSSDFKASIDVGFVVANPGDPADLKRVQLTAFKTRVSVTPAMILEFDADTVTWSERSGGGHAAMTRSALIEVLTENPGVIGCEFEKLATARGIARNEARRWLENAALRGEVTVETGPRNSRRFTLRRGPE